MLKNSKWESYALSPEEEMFSDNELSVGLSTKTDKNINTLKNFTHQGDQSNHLMQRSSFNERVHNIGMIYWLIYPALHLSNIILCSWRAIKEIALPVIMVIGMLNMFSLSAQTPRKDSGADGESKEVSIGHSVPKEFWNKEHLFFINGDTIRKTLAEHKGKMVVLDFWSTGCAPCLLHQSKIKEYVDANKKNLVVVMVNSVNTRDRYTRFKTLYQNGFFENFGIKHVETIIHDDYLLSLFPYTSYPHYVWINEIGRLQLRTFRNLLDKEYVAPFIY